MSDVALAQGAADEAYRYAEQALALARELPAPAFATCALRVMGEARLKQDDVETAAPLLSEAWQIQQDVNDPFDEPLIRAALAHLALKQSDRAQVLEHIEKGLAVAKEKLFPYQIRLLEQLRRQIADL